MPPKVKIVKSLGKPTKKSQKTCFRKMNFFYRICLYLCGKAWFIWFESLMWNIWSYCGCNHRIFLKKQSIGVVVNTICTVFQESRGPLIGFTLLARTSLLLELMTFTSIYDIS